MMWAAALSLLLAIHHHHGGSPSETFLLNQASGTSTNPQGGSPHEMTMLREGDWNVMLHGLMFVNNTRATGYRGKSKEFSTNWLMAMGERPLGGGALMLRAMLSAEPWTIRNRVYPELFQTG